VGIGSWYVQHVHEYEDMLRELCLALDAGGAAFGEGFDFGEFGHTDIAGEGG
jgi:hypothetical protein